MKRALVVLMLCGCPEKKAQEHAATPVVDAGLVITKNRVPEPTPPQDAEVEFSGSIDAGTLRPARLVFVISKNPCDDIDVLEQIDVNPGAFFTEIFFPQGTPGHLCGLALDDKNQVIAQAAYAKNPVKFEGQGEVMFSDVKLDLAPVKPPRPAPKGL